MMHRDLSNKRHIRVWLVYEYETDVNDYPEEIRDDARAMARYDMDVDVAIVFDSDPDIERAEMSTR